MKTIKLFQASMLLVMTLIAAGCTNDEAKTEQQGTNGTPAGTTVFSGETRPSTTTRTAIVDHTKGGSAKVNWAATDKVWVKDDASAWQQSGAATFPVAANKAKAMFSLNGTYTGATHDVIYTNLPITGTPQVEIKSTQTQSASNNFDHAGASGDCAIATAHGGDGSYTFYLNHKASYICFIPRSSNEFVHRSKLTKIEIVSDDNICGTYDIAANGALTLASGGSKTITLTTGSGFDIDNPADDLDKNAAYAVIAPGTYTLRIRYWLKNLVDGVDNAGNLAPIEGTVTKYVTMTFEAGKIHDITANLDPKNYPGNNYYMWDAQVNYWSGHEWNTATPWQPTLRGSSNTNYAQNNTDSRWYNETYLGPGNKIDAQTTLFKSLPNINEASWYAEKGDPHWDADELWSSMGHLYKGGMWFKRKSVLLADGNYSTEVSSDGITDMRKTNRSSGSLASQSLPAIATMANYFYLPALAWYYEGSFGTIGSWGYYWTSSAKTEWGNDAYVLDFYKNAVSVTNFSFRKSGNIAQPFRDFGDN